MTAPRSAKSLFARHGKGPLLAADRWPYPAHSVFNPGAVRLRDGTTLLLCRVEDHRGLSHLTAARSRNGIDRWAVDPEPTLASDPLHHPEELWGIEDPRATFIPELGRCAVAYTAYGRSGPGVSLALTEDFRSFERLGLVQLPDNKDAALLPRRVDGAFVLLHRPVSLDGAHIWLSHSPDLRHWGRPRQVLRARLGGWWDAGRIGLGPPPIETPQGWLVIYHGVRRTVSGCIYRVGLALLALEDPARCLLRGDSWVFGPETADEQVGDVGQVTFPCGATVADDGDTLHLYYGAADTTVGLATGSVRECLEWLERNGQPPEMGTGSGPAT
ncbi:MAG: glycosidase [Holophaga sp.]